MAQPLHQDATVRVLTQIRGGSVDEIRREITKAATAPIKQADYPSDSVTRFVALSPGSTIAQLAAISNRLDEAGSSLSIVSSNSWAAAGFVAEGAPIAFRQGAFSGTALGTIKKLALLAALSAELYTATGGSAQTIISGLLEDAIRRGADGILLGSAPAQLMPRLVCCLASRRS